MPAPPRPSISGRAKRRRDVPILWPESLEAARQEDNMHELLQLFRYDIEWQYRQPIHPQELETKFLREKQTVPQTVAH